ncbi:MAG: DUF2842 domain-containing protein [Hyphomicrobiales bacterium]|nr:MAG: DUF2842 domain-containing protein [Hyphomicrobiales bacterium]
MPHRRGAAFRCLPRDFSRTSLRAGWYAPPPGFATARFDAGFHVPDMTQSTRKLIGTILTLLSIVVWCVLVSAIYMSWLSAAPWWALILFFAVAGAAWFFPAAWIIRWMAKPDAA